MVEVLVPADVEVAAVDELDARMPALGFPGVWGTRIPAGTRPQEFGRIVSLGGTERDLVTGAHTIAVEAFAAGEGRAERMCAFAVAALQAAGRSGELGGHVCYGVRVAALPANLPMPSVPDRFRFTATVAVELRKATA